MEDKMHYLKLEPCLMTGRPSAKSLLKFAAVGVMAIAIQINTLTTTAQANEQIPPVMACEQLTSLDLRSLEGARSRIDSAEIVEIEDLGPQCVVKGYSASDVRFEVRLPLDSWTGRFLMLGCGGYCGGVNANPMTNQARMTAGCEPITNGEFVTASSDLGHTRSATFFADGLWAYGNPGAVVDLAYAGMEKATIVSKAIIDAYYGQPQNHSYFVGCSDGGRQALQMAQRFPEEYDGIVVGAPVIDKAINDSMYHAWGIRANTGADGKAILTANKIPALFKAVTQACGDEGGLIQDPRACAWDPAEIVCAGADNSECLSKAQADVVRKLWEGPKDENGNLLTPHKMPKGSENAWVGTMVPKNSEAAMDHTTLGDATWSYDYPMFASGWNTPTGLDYSTMKFDRETYNKLTELAQLSNPNNPDLSAFADSGGRMILWHGWADPGVPPFSSLNYYTAVRAQMGAEATDDFLVFYLPAGVNHCGGGPREAKMDFLAPMLDWVENGKKPDKVNVNFYEDNQVARTRPEWPYPSQSIYSGSGDLADAGSWKRAELPKGLPEKVEWVGLDDYRPNNTMWCNWKGSSLVCELR